VKSGLLRRVAKLERRRPRRLSDSEARKMRVIDDWITAVTGKRITEMSDAELERLEQLFRGDQLMGDDASELVLACMDENQVVVDLERRRQQLDRGQFR
jgi:hypothetical protein